MVKEGAIWEVLRISRESPTEPKMEYFNMVGSASRFTGCQHEDAYVQYTHIQCVAYGALAHHLNALWCANTADVVVTVLRLWRIEWGDGGFNYVTNMEGGSDILFDSDIPEIQFFKSQ
ncbi:unnamed protein product [Brassica rapa]|uniref:Uncharacterized protein n=1 Tax=Brassica campestris TaxID=3711 RepID=A0A8D9D1M3_BRACM|nr:unnamed protein product [Brassica rapa]